MQWCGEPLLSNKPLHKKTNVRVCAFRVLHDFVVFSLHRTKEGTLEFPETSPDNAVDLIDEDMNPTYVGSLLHNGNIFLWYKCETNNTTPAQFLNKSDRKWWVLSSEIVNWQKVLHFPVEESVVELFMTHPNLLFVENSNGEKK